jgi:hypothetical protein
VGTPSPPVVLRKYSLFKALAALIYRKHFVLRYLEPKNLKTKNLCGRAHGAGPGEMPRRVCARDIALNYRLVD